VFIEHAAVADTLTVYGPAPPALWNVRVWDPAVCVTLTVPVQGYAEQGLVESPDTVATTTPEPLPEISAMPLTRVPVPALETEREVPVMAPVAVTVPNAVTMVFACTQVPLMREKRAMEPLGVPDTTSCVPEMLPVKIAEPVATGQ